MSTTTNKDQNPRFKYQSITTRPTLNAYCGYASTISTDSFGEAIITCPNIDTLKKILGTLNEKYCSTKTHLVAVIKTWEITSVEHINDIKDNQGTCPRPILKTTDGLVCEWLNHDHETITHHIPIKHINIANGQLAIEHFLDAGAFIPIDEQKDLVEKLIRFFNEWDYLKKHQH